MDKLLHNRLRALAIMAAGFGILLLGIASLEMKEWQWWFGWGVIGAGAGAFLSFTVRGAIIGAIVLLASFYALLYYGGAIR